MKAELLEIRTRNCLQKYNWNPSRKQAVEMFGMPRFYSQKASCRNVYVCFWFFLSCLQRSACGHQEDACDGDLGSGLIFKSEKGNMCKLVSSLDLAGKWWLIKLRLHVLFYKLPCHWEYNWGVYDCYIIWQ